ncbi:PREDICTED: centromere-associated protein E-like [Ceratosolen solmsi marchali]|uniref:Centromere-associated protein E-like n=1 Tax=Ceratosolen solmsi marchali TaxID=326594 RepID=A0AAJ6YQ27_9HYME|nr:PREDICTED: centromere-associated protein E-like [Ceratosolen solmsi marchali]
MSFSKARIQRFNELPSEVPPPGAYDPKFGSNVSGSIAKKTGRLNDAKSTTSSGAEYSASVSSRSTSIKQFRTPQLPKKRVFVKPTGTSCPRARTKLYAEQNNLQSKYGTDQELSDLRVECANKDKTLHEYEKQIDDMRAEFQDLTEKYKTLQNDNSQVEKQHRNEIESMLSFILKSQEEEMYEKRKIEEEFKRTISNLERQLRKQKEQDELINQMTKLEVATIKLDKIHEDMNDTLDTKDLQVTDILKFQSKTEHTLTNVQIELQKSENQVANFEDSFHSIDNDNNPAILTIDPQLIGEMTGVLQEYIDYDNSDGKWNVKSMSFHPDVERFLKTIRTFIVKLKLAYEHEAELSRDNFNEERENLEQKLETNRTIVTDLKHKLTETNETNRFLTEELQDVQDLYKDMNCTMSEMKTQLELANDKYTKELAVHKTELELISKRNIEERTKLKDLLEEARSEYLKELDNMTSARNEELSEVKQAMEKRIEDEKKRMKEGGNKMVENAEAITRETLNACRAESEERVKRVIAETDALTREAKNVSEEELRKATEKYNCRLDHLENEKDTLTTKLGQQDVEIIQLTAALEEMKCTAETQESFSQSLQAELDRAEAELMEKKEELRNLKDQIRMESAEMVARRRRFDVVMSENQASVAALTHRLAQSEAEVERLQKELQTNEGSLTGYCDLFESIVQDSKMVQEELHSITNKVEEKVDIINQLEVQSVTEINTAKTAFNAKIENLKSVTIHELSKAQKECKSKCEQIIELKGNLCQMSDRLSEAMNMLLKLEEINDGQSIELSQLELQNIKLQQQLDNKNQIIEGNGLSFTTQLQCNITEMTEMNQQLSKLTKEIKILKENRDEIEKRKYDFDELRLKYDDEISVLTKGLESEQIEREKLEKQVKEYERICEHLKDQCKQVSDKYTETINQNNHKQRIKQMSQLQEKIDIQQVDLLRLRQELESKSDLINELHQANEKLKFDERRQLGLGKENMHVISSPHKTLFPKSTNTTPVASPHKPHTPLRDRND